MKRAFGILRAQGPAVFFARASSGVFALYADLRRRYLRRMAWRKLLRAKRFSTPLFFPSYAEPLVSIIIPVFEQLPLTQRCLHAIAQYLDPSLPTEIIVVDDCSADGTASYLEQCSGIRVLRQDTNRGFVDSANFGAASARGAFLHFLNNDTIVTGGWLRHLLDLLQRDLRIGAAGSQLLAPDGRISEAGAIVWNDGSGSNYGRGCKADDSRFCYVRDVDYCSAASFLVRRDVFEQVGGFSPTFRPAYYEDVDLCFAMRAAGYRVVYQPKSVVIHFEGGTAGTNLRAGAKQSQVANQRTFAHKWASELAHHFPPDISLTEAAARRLQGSRRVLVVDTHVPFFDRDAGSRRLYGIMRLLQQLGSHVAFLPDDGKAHEPYTSVLRQQGVEVITGASRRFSLDTLTFPIDVAWLSRPEICERYLPLVRKRANTKIVYDTVDLHHLRLAQAEKLTGKATRWQDIAALEYRLARAADRIVVTTDLEQRLLAEQGIDSVVIPIIEPAMSKAVRVPWQDRSTLLFVGNYAHAPNVDAAVWLRREIMPLVWAVEPSLRVVLAGADPTVAIQRLKSSKVEVPGFKLDLTDTFAQARVFVAPLRFGAGMKGKIVESLAHGLPVVTTSIGAMGIGLANSYDALIADDADAFAQAVLRLYHDRDFWEVIANNALTAAQRFSPENALPAVAAALRFD
ncbi:MAG: glycosyltransferase [Vulcanimicrobiaceae bacterium]